MRQVRWDFLFEKQALNGLLKVIGIQKTLRTGINIISLIFRNGNLSKTNNPKFSFE